jgi:hypothetical protein
MHATNLPSSVKFLLGVLIATCVFTVAANAHPGFAGKFTLPYEVHFGRTVLPAGEYFIQMDATMAPAMISSASGSMPAVYTNVLSIADNERGGTHLTVTTQGNERTVRSLNSTELGKLVIFAPLTKSEREAFAKTGQLEVVPVLTVKKK